jgi:hypothetical protein
MTNTIVSSLLTGDFVHVGIKPVYIEAKMQVISTWMRAHQLPLSGAILDIAHLCAEHMW